MQPAGQARCAEAELRISTTNKGIGHDKQSCIPILTELGLKWAGIAHALSPQPNGPKCFTWAVAGFEVS